MTPEALVDESRRHPLASNQLLPAPVKSDDGDARWLPGFHDWQNAKIDPAFPAIRAELIAALKKPGYPGERADALVPMRVEIIKSAIDGAPERVAAQAYQLTLHPGLLRIAAPSEAGAYYAVQTLRQLLPTAGTTCLSSPNSTCPATPPPSGALSVWREWTLPVCERS